MQEVVAAEGPQRQAPDCQPGWNTQPTDQPEELDEIAHFLLHFHLAFVQVPEHMYVARGQVAASSNMACTFAQIRLKCLNGRLGKVWQRVASNKY